MIKRFFTEVWARLRRLEIGEVIFIFKAQWTRNSYSTKAWKDLWSRRDKPTVRDVALKHGGTEYRQLIG